MDAGGGSGGGGWRRRPRPAVGQRVRSRHARLDLQPPDRRRVGRAGNIYIADGLGTNNRIAKFDKDGRFLAHWGSTGAGPGSSPA